MKNKKVMGQEDLIPFSSLIAGILLVKRNISSVEIVNVLSRITNLGIIIDDRNDSIDCLFPCIELDSEYCFRLKDNFSYETMLFPNVSVRDFLMQQTNEKVLSFLSNDVLYRDLYQKQIFYSSEISCCHQKVEKEDKNYFVNKTKKRSKLRKYKQIAIHALLGEFF